MACGCEGYKPSTSVGLYIWVVPGYPGQTQADWYYYWEGASPPVPLIGEVMQLGNLPHRVVRREFAYGCVDEDHTEAWARVDLFVQRT